MTKFTVAENCRVKVGKEYYVDGDTFEAEESEVQNLVDSGSVFSGSAPKKKSVTKKSGKEVETPPEEGKLGEDGETTEIK